MNGKLTIGSLSLPSRFLLAPLAGYTNLAFRLAVRELGGVGLATTDLINPRALLGKTRKSCELIQTCPEDRPLAVQLYGAEPAAMALAARWLEDQGVQVVDINMGCPVHKVCRNGGGSAMLGDREQAVRLVRQVVSAVKIPVTVKMRLGWDEDNWSAPQLAREFEQAGIAAITIHGRTRAQGFRGTVQLAGIRAVVEAVQAIPIIGNGDVRTIADAQRMLSTTGCAGIAIGRGALLNPWIFQQLQKWEVADDLGPLPAYQDHLHFMNRHFQLLVAQRGERFACLTFRKVANWYCRVLRPGRQIQQRLMRLDRVADFEAIVEQLRLRGPAPNGHREIDTLVPVPRSPVALW